MAPSCDTDERCLSHDHQWMLIMKEKQPDICLLKEATPLGCTLANNSPLRLSELLDLIIGSIRDGHLLQSHDHIHSKTDYGKLCRGDNQFSSMGKYMRKKGDLDTTCQTHNIRFWSLIQTAKLNSVC